MARLSLPPKASILFSQAKIAGRVRVLGREITRYYRGQQPVFLGVMNGALFFLADLLRAIDLDPEIATVRLASYSGVKSTGRLRGLGGLRASVKGRQVLIVDDILDTGLTLGALRQRLLDLEAADVKICVLLAKRRPRDIPVHADWIGFSIRDQFVIGYGVDHNERYRTLNEVRVLPGKP